MVLLWPFSTATHALQSTPDSVDFGQVSVFRNRRIEVSLYHAGLAPVLVDHIIVYGQGYDLPAPPLTGASLLLAPSDSLRFAVQFTSTAPGFNSGQLRVSSVADTLIIPLHATATAVFIDEVLADPPAGSAGDANNDGTRHTYQDEFVELINAGPDTVSLDGWHLGDDDTAANKWFTFPTNAHLAPNGRALLFGGGVPTGFDVPVFIDDGRIGNGLTNGGDQIWLLDADGDTADIVLESNWPKDQSLVRSPSATGPFTAHSAVSTAVEAFSPGQAVLQIDTLATTSSDSTTGTDTSSQETTSTAAITDTSATTATPEQTTEIPPVPPPLVFIDEVLADPPTGSVGDANRDGTRHTYEDEFIELVNADPDTVSLAGWHLSDDDVAPDLRFTFPADARLVPNGRVLLFGGGAPTGFSVPVFVDDGRIGNGLTNGGDQIWLLDANGDTVDTVLQSNWPNDQSLVRWPSATGPFTAHSAAANPAEAFSPGQAVLQVDTLATSSSNSTTGADTLSPETTPTTATTIDPDTLAVDNDSLVTTSTATTNTGTDTLTTSSDSSATSSSTSDTSSTAITETSATTATPEQTTEISLAPPPLVFIDEVLADPPTGSAGDANRDGMRHTYEDEFIELVNVGPDTVSLTGWRLGDDDVAPNQWFVFPAEVHMLPGTRVVLFGGGSPTGFDVPVFVDDGRIGNGLTNGGDQIWLIDANANTVDTVLESDWPNDQSLVRWPTATGLFIAHSAAANPAEAFSPGQAVLEVDTLATTSTNSTTGADTLSSETTSTPADSTAVTDTSATTATPEQTTEISPVPPPLVFIDEVLADPPTGSAGDANQDGVRHTYEDEFIELVNAGPDTISLTGWRLGDDDVTPDQWFAFPAEVRMFPGSRVVLFGGGSPTGFDVPVFADDGRIGNGLTNGGDQIWLIDANGDTVDKVLESNWPNDQSLVRFPSASGPFIAHSTASTGGTIFSPGQTLLTTAVSPPTDATTLADSTAIAALEDSAEEMSSPQSSASLSSYSPLLQIIVSEILADPPAGSAGDANDDGTRDIYQDEFIELFNAGTVPVDLSGWHLSDDDTHGAARFRFPAETILPAGAYLVLFGGGTPGDIPGLVFVDNGRIGNGLTNGKDRLLLIVPDGSDTLIDLTYASATNIDQSLVMQADTSFTAHGQLPGMDLFSPGRAQPTYTHFHIPPLQLTLSRTSATLQLDAYDGIDTVRINASLFTWTIIDTTIVSVDKKAHAVALRPGISLVEARTADTLLAVSTIHVQPPPDRPPVILSIPDTTVYIGGHYHYQVEAFDPEVSPLNYRFLEAPSWMRIDPFNGHIVGRAPSTAAAQATVAIGVDDNHSGLTLQTYRLHFLLPPALHITEVLADPPPGAAGDANGDGQRQTYADEFIELFNAGTTPFNLDGCYLSDGDRDARFQFHFPPNTQLLPNSYVVVFGGSLVPSPAVFAARGRLGDGLNNKRDEIYLIDPGGPDTLASRTYALQREPNQSLHWPLDASNPILHGQFPSRDLFSPGRPRPLLTHLHLVPSRPRLIAGQDLSLRLMATFSDGDQSPSVQNPTWHSSNSGVATVNAQGLVTAVDSGTAAISARLDTFTAQSSIVQVRQPLAQRLSFQPHWHRLALTTDREFIFRVLTPQDKNRRCQWVLNGRIQSGFNNRPTFIYAPKDGDTISVRVESRHEFATRQWIVTANLPPVVQPLQDTLAWVNQPYQTSITCRDPDDDPLLYTLSQGPPGMRLNPSSGALQWLPTTSDSGSIPLQIDIHDGHNKATLTCTLHVLTVAAKPTISTRLLLYNVPNPFNSMTTISFYLPDVQFTPTSAYIYNLAGQLIHTLVHQNFDPGWHELIWQGIDTSGRPVASGLYLCLLIHGPQRHIAKLVLLR